jgi:hypothetical protein|tara:strand:+ start:987 stop:1130 length:144 start_codon:yes stop_codon:yes gene_type:complete
MTHPKDRKLKIEELESIRKAVDESGIRAVHPDKLEEWAEYLVRKLKQ